MTSPEHNPVDIPARTPMPRRQVALDNVPPFGPQPTMRVDEEINLDNSEDTAPENGDDIVNVNNEESDGDFSIGELTN